MKTCVKSMIFQRTRDSGQETCSSANTNEHRDLERSKMDNSKEVKKSKLEKKPSCIHCGWAMGEREGEPLCSHCKR